MDIFDGIGEGLLEFFNQTSRDVPLVLHPEAFLERRLNNPSVGPVNVPILNEKDLKNAGAKIIKSEGPLTLASDLILLTGEVERTTTFKKVFHGLKQKLTVHGS